MVNHWLSAGELLAELPSWYFCSARTGEDVGVADKLLRGPGRGGGDAAALLAAAAVVLAAALPIAAACGRSSPCTWRKVSGSIAWASRSTMPNGAAANLAIGGASPVCTLSGKLEALSSARPALSFKSRGSSTL